MLPITRIVLLALLLALAGCELWDPPKGEIGLRITKDGKQYGGCLVNVYNAEGRQIRREAVSQMGVCYVRHLNPGVITLKFVGIGDEPFPAVRTVTINPGSSAFLAVELSQEKDPEGEAEASRGGGKDYGVEDISP
jgi:hypothetical protein